MPTNLFYTWLDRYLLPIDDPGSRLFGLNLASSFFLIACYFWWANKKNLFEEMKKAVFRKKYWWNRSTKQDYKLYILNSFLKILLIYPFIKISFWFSSLVVSFLVKSFGILPAQTNIFSLILFSLFAFILDDFMRFMHHYFMHRIPFLWEFHKIHHSAKILTPITLYRIHPLESAFATFRNSASYGILLGVFIFFFDTGAELHTLLGISSFGILFNLLGSNLRHSHIPLSFGPLEYIFISPAQHQLHHATQDGANLGVSLSIWDQFTGSFRRSEARKKMRFGLLN